MSLTSLWGHRDGRGKIPPILKLIISRTNILCNGIQGILRILLGKSHVLPKAYLYNYTTAVLNRPGGEMTEKYPESLVTLRSCAEASGML